MAYLIGEPLIISGEIQGYRVVDESGVFRNIKLDDIDKLAKKHLINAETIKDESGRIHVLVQGEAATYQDPRVYSVEQRVVQNGKTRAYRCKDQNGTSRSFTPEKLWELARSGKVQGIEAIVINDKRTLVGKDGNSIENIPVAKV